jgi:coenzyme F420-0:L-glutamate ligase/coenzyme F420-1:gamma-L-glutamate ligase
MSTPPAGLSVWPLAGIPLVQAGDDLAALVLGGLRASALTLEDGDVVVLAQKVVSKAEGRVVDLATVTPSARAIEMAPAADKDPRLVELVLSESAEVLRTRPGALIVVHRLGFVCANAGIDQSNVSGANSDAADAQCLLLPLDPDASAARLRAELKARTGREVAVLIIDSFGRAWRNGTMGQALGVAGMPGLLDLRTRPDLFGRPLKHSELGLADEAAAAASLMMGQADEGRPVVLMRGVPYPRRDGTGAELVRPRHLDLFR